MSLLSLPTRTDLHRIEIKSMFDIIHMANDREKLVLYGYITELHVSLPKNNITQVPELITIICLWYYVCFDEELLVESFDNMNLKNNLLRGIYHYGLEKPSFLNQRVIVPIIRYQDVIVQAQSGTSKVTTFGIASLQLLDTANTQCQILIIAPTRELARNTLLVIDNLSHFLHITTKCFVGGTNIRDNIKILQSETVQLIVATTGRMLDLISRQILQLDALKLLVVDQADMLFDCGFQQQLYQICNMLQHNTQIAVFSAAITNDVEAFAEKFMIKPMKIRVKKMELTLCGIKQFYIQIEKEDYKLMTLTDLLESLSISQCVIYVNTKANAVCLEDEMKTQAFNCGCIFGEMDRAKRNNILNEFRNGKRQILITTDLMEFGVDLYTMKFMVSLVINYDLPNATEHYLYRIGRSGKYGRKGVCINFVCDNDTVMLDNIRTHYCTQIDELPMNIADIL